MPTPPRLTIWSYWRYVLKWVLLIFPLIGVCLLLAQGDYPLLALLPLVLYVVFYVRDTVRVFRPIRGKIIRRVGGYVENPRNLRRTVGSTVAAVALWYLFVFWGFYLLLGLLSTIVVVLLLRPFAIRYGWFTEGRIAARFRRPRFIDERFRGSVDPTGEV